MTTKTRLSDDELDAWRINVVTWGLIERSLDRQLQRDSGLPHAYYGILIALSTEEGRSLPLTRIAAHLGFSQSRLSHAVKRLEASGWVERSVDAEDRRVTTLRLTPTGRTALGRASVGHLSEVRRVFASHLDEADLRDITRIGLKLLDAVTADDPDLQTLRSSVGLPVAESRD